MRYFLSVISIMLFLGLTVLVLDDAVAQSGSFGQQTSADKKKMPKPSISGPKDEAYSSAGNEEICILRQVGYYCVETQVCSSTINLIHPDINENDNSTAITNYLGCYEELSQHIIDFMEEVGLEELPECKNNWTFEYEANENCPSASSGSSGGFGCPPVLVDLACGDRECGYAPIGTPGGAFAPCASCGTGCPWGVCLYDGQCYNGPGGSSGSGSSGSSGGFGSSGSSGSSGG